MMLGDRISATEAERIGMIYKIFLMIFFAEAEKIATTLSQLPTKVLLLRNRL